MQDFGAGGAERVGPTSYPVNATTRLVKGGVIDLERQRNRGIEASHQGLGEQSPEIIE
jgi:hypothetical protein